MKQWRIKRGIVLIFLGTFLYVGMLHADPIPAAVLDALKAVRTVILELLATSEFSSKEELKGRFEAAAKALQEVVQKHGAAIGLGDDSSSTAASSSSALPTVTPMPVPTNPVTTPAIVVAAPQTSSPLGAPTSDESAESEEITPEPPAAALGASVAPGGEAIQPPAVLAAPVVVPAVPVPGGVPATSSAVPGIADIQSMGDLTIPADGTAVQPVLGVPDAAGLMPLGDLTALPPLETTPTVAPAPAMPGVMAPQPLQPAFGAVPAPKPMTPAPLGTPPASVMQELPGLQALPPLAPLAYHEFDSLDSLDGEMAQLMAMNIPSLPVLSNIQPLATVSEYDQEVLNMELMSLAMQEVPSIVMDETLDDLNLNDLTLAGLE